MICLVVALSAEARPLIDAFKLRRHTGINGYQVYSNNEFVYLIISGIGRLASASATAYLQGLLNPAPVNHPSQNSIEYGQMLVGWLNIGIAGTASLDVGGDVMAHSITDSTSQKRFYPGLCFPLPVNTVDIISSDAPITRYSGNNVYDMEAAGFFSSAVKFSSSEVIHSYKVISDNESNPVENISEQFVIELIKNKTDTIKEIITNLRSLVDELNSINADPMEFKTINSQWRFTISQQHQLKSLLIRWQALTSSSFINSNNADGLKTGKQLLSQLEKSVNRQSMQTDQE